MEASARVAELSRRLREGGLRAVVVGAGKSGRAAIDLLRKYGATVEILDDREDLDADGVRAKPIEAEAVGAADLVVLSPGVPRARPELAGAVARGKLVSEIELASWFVSAPMVGITGTNGKSTTTALVAHILEKAGKRVFAGGNLGRPLSELATSGEPVDVAVVELSSYQLESIVDARFAVACWLNLTPDHVDRYPNIETYAAAKRRIIERRAVHGVAVLNADDGYCAGAGIRLGGPIRWFGMERSNLVEGTIVTGASAIRTIGGRTETYRLGSRALPGAHNRSNASAAIECARHFDDVTPEAVQAGLDTFPGLPHRLEEVLVRGGVRWINDSKATNVDSAVIGVRAIDGPKILIAGGKDKGSSWAPLVDAARAQGVRAVLAIGAASPLVEAAFTGFDVTPCGTIERAVEIARSIARPGDSVLLSPACASFDQFRNFEHRGDRFRELVRTATGGGR
jgi:UDP-N-acetylmuramoylalanine--D-glutamate ligase